MWLTSYDFRNLQNSLLMKLVPLSVIRVAGVPCVAKTGLIALMRALLLRSGSWLSSIKVDIHQHYIVSAIYFKTVTGH